MRLSVSYMIASFPGHSKNEAKNSKDTQNMGAINQGAKACINFLAPLLWNLNADGYSYVGSKDLVVKDKKDIPVLTMDQLL